MTGRSSATSVKLSDGIGGSIHFRSAWQTKKKSNNDSSTMTDSDANEMIDQSTQAVSASEISTQTESAVDTCKTTDNLTDLALTLEDIGKSDAETLQDLGSLMLEELHRNDTSTAFEDWVPWCDEADEGGNSNTKLHSLVFDSASYFAVTNPEDEDGDKTRTASLQCTDVSWNATGSVIAVSYGNFEHSGWCTYSAALCLWNVFGSKFNPTKPDIVLETSSGLMCTAFHPTIPSIIVAGSFNGEVLVWNTAAAAASSSSVRENEDNDDDSSEMLFASSEIGDYFHREPITSVSWIYDMEERDYQIISVSGDGKILIWSLKNKLVAPVQGFMLKSKTTSSSILGGTALTVNTVSKSNRTFIVGTEGGAIFRSSAKVSVRASVEGTGEKWSFGAKKILKGLGRSKEKLVSHVSTYAKQRGIQTVDSNVIYASKPDLKLLYSSAAEFKFDTHSGPVHSLAWSPFNRNLFLSCSLDGTICLYNTLQSSPVLTFEPAANVYIFSVAWSKTRPMVFAAAANDGRVYFYDLHDNTVKPVLILEAESKKSPLYSIEFNPRQRNFVAGASAAGEVAIWKLGWKLATTVPNEVALIDSVADLANDLDE